MNANKKQAKLRELVVEEMRNIDPVWDDDMWGNTVGYETEQLKALSESVLYLAEEEIMKDEEVMALLDEETIDWRLEEAIKTAIQDAHEKVLQDQEKYL